MAPPSTATHPSLPPWPPANKPLNTILQPADKARLFVGGRTHINAPASFVFERLTRIKGYKDWCTFIPSMWMISQPQPSSAVSAPTSSTSNDADALKVGCVCGMKAVMNPHKPDQASAVQVRISDWSTPSQRSAYVSEELLRNDGSWGSDLSKTYRVAWSIAGFTSWFISGERFSECIVVGEDECEFRSWELQGGLVAILVRLFYGKVLDERFETFASDLKAVCEREYARS